MKKIQILGTGCPKCNQLSANAEEAAKTLGIAYELEKVTGINDIVTYGVMTTPALVVDGTVRSVGKVLTSKEIEPLLA